MVFKVAKKLIKFYALTQRTFVVANQILYQLRPTLYNLFQSGSSKKSKNRVINRKTEKSQNFILENQL